MMGAYQFAAFTEKELVWRETQGTALVRADIAVSAYGSSDPEQRHVRGAVRSLHDQLFAVGFADIADTTHIAHY